MVRTFFMRSGIAPRHHFVFFSKVAAHDAYVGRGHLSKQKILAHGALKCPVSEILEVKAVT